MHRAAPKKGLRHENLVVFGLRYLEENLEPKLETIHRKIGALIITNSIFGVPYYIYSIMGSKTQNPILIIKAPIVNQPRSTADVA